MTRPDRDAVASRLGCSLHCEGSQVKHARAGIVLTALFSTAWFVLLAPTAIGGWTSYIRVSGHSMEPTYHTNDLVLVRQQEAYRAGDVVAFRVERGQVIHRIVGGDGHSGFQTRGDHNQWNDPWKPRASDVTGRAWLRIPNGGAALDFARQPYGVGLIAALATTLVLADERTKRRRRENASAAASESGDSDHSVGASPR